MLRVLKRVCVLPQVWVSVLCLFTCSLYAHDQNAPEVLSPPIFVIHATQAKLTPLNNNNYAIRFKHNAIKKAMTYHPGVDKEISYISVADLNARPSGVIDFTEPHPVVILITENKEQSRVMKVVRSKLENDVLIHEVTFVTPKPLDVTLLNNVSLFYQADRWNWIDVWLYRDSAR